jgi:hypothetical protein
MVEERCKGEQLHLDVKQEPREVDFVPFRPGNGVSIFEFFHKFENWARGQMSQDHKANVLYNRHLDFSVTDGNKELEEAKENYSMMKSLLIEKWGVADIVCDQYLEGIRRIKMPTDPKDKVGMLTYVKNAYSRLVTLTKLEVDRGQLVPGLEDYYLSNQFLKRIHRLLPEDLGSRFLMKLQENGESYYLMKGRQYMDRIIALLRCYYKSLEIALEDRPDLPIITKSGTVSSTGINVMSTSGYANGQESHSPVEPPREPAQLSIMAMIANATASRQSASQPTGQSQGGGQSKKPNPQNGNGKPKPKFEFAPNNGTGQITYQPKVRGPRWACPVKGHSGHTIAQCRDFWGAENCIEGRKLMGGTGCYTCLGRDQGCGAGACAIVKEVPKDTICQECAGYASRTGTPPNILCCGLPFHKKPVVKDVMEIMERWIPDFKASSLGVQVGVNWLQVNHSLVSNREAEWKDDNAGKSLVYNTQTGKTRAVNITDRVVSTPSECACYVMQQLNIAGRRVLAFFNSGANSNIVEYDLARDAGFHQIGFQTVSFNVAGGGSVRSSYGQFSAILGPDVNGNIHDIECQAVDQITGTFPTFRLDDIITEARATIGSHHVFPQEIGGAPVKLLIGIRNTQLAPVLKFTLPSGLCVYESKFRDVYGATLCFGGPHEVFTHGYRQAGFRVTSGMLQVLFTESATAYMGGIRAVVGPPSRKKRPLCPPATSPVPRPLWHRSPCPLALPVT